MRTLETYVLEKMLENCMRLLSRTSQNAEKHSKNGSTTLDCSQKIILESRVADIKARIERLVKKERYLRDMKNTAYVELKRRQTVELTESF